MEEKIKAIAFDTIDAELDVDINNASDVLANLSMIDGIICMAKNTIETFNEDIEMLEQADNEEVMEYIRKTFPNFLRG